MGMVLLVVIGIILALNWEDITTKEGGEIVLTPDRERKIDEREKILLKAELYALLSVNYFQFLLSNVSVSSTGPM